MPDIIDKAAEISELFLRTALLNKQPIGPEPTGECLNCGLSLPPPQRWCDAECRDDWQRGRRGR